MKVNVKSNKYHTRHSIPETLLIGISTVKVNRVSNHQRYFKIKQASWGLLGGFIFKLKHLDQPLNVKDGP